ncbi:MAG: hypothetical protein AAGH15_26990, partial [Myxococcota bacterium]
MPGPEHRPTLLLAGDGEPLEDALVAALDRRDVAVRRAPGDAKVETAIATAPDMMVLMGDAVRDGGRSVLRAMAQSPAASVVPVALLMDDATLDARMRAFRAGAVAVVERSASADAVAERIAGLLAELPERPGEARGELGETTLDEIVDLVRRELRSGILSVSRDGEAAHRVVLGAGGDVAKALESFVRELQPLVAKAEPLRYHLLEATGGRLRLDEGDTGVRGDRRVLRDLRVLLLDDDSGRADLLAQALRGEGSQVAVARVALMGLDQARALDPTVILLDATAIDGVGFDVVRAIRRDPRLRWASLLVASLDELCPSGGSP